MEIVDTHCHLDVPAFDADRRQVIARAYASGVTAVVVPGIDAAGWPGLLQLCDGTPGLYPALGLHPVYLEQHAAADLQALATRVQARPPLAIGEIGLDYFIDGLDRVRQQALFEAQLRIAREAELPVLLHVRKAHDQVLAALRRFGIRRGIAHAFSGSEQQAHQYIELGFKLGFGGVMTYERSKKIRRLAATLPAEAIVLETDAPDLPPEGHRGERNSPEYLPQILQVLAQLRGEAPAQVAAQTTRNAREVLGLPAGEDGFGL